MHRVCRRMPRVKKIMSLKNRLQVFLVHLMPKMLRNPALLRFLLMVTINLSQFRKKLKMYKLTKVLKPNLLCNSNYLTNLSFKKSRNKQILSLVNNQVPVPKISRVEQPPKTLL